jgi:hypothetical protein
MNPSHFSKKKGRFHIYRMLSEYARRRNSFLKLTVCCVCLTLTGCLKEPEGNGTFVTDATATQAFFSGDWRVNLYEVNGEDQRNGHFDEFFNFNPDHTVNVTRVTTKIIGGRWWVDASGPSENAARRDLMISFSFRPVFDLSVLNGHWAILERSAKQIYLLKTQDGVVTYLGLHKIK